MQQEKKRGGGGITRNVKGSSELCYFTFSAVKSEVKAENPSCTCTVIPTPPSCDTTSSCPFEHPEHGGVAAAVSRATPASYGIYRVATHFCTSKVKITDVMKRGISSTHCRRWSFLKAL